MKIQISVCQMNVSHDKKTNLAKAKSMITNAASAGSQIAVLPEMFNCPYESSFFKSLQKNFQGQPQTLFQALQKIYQSTLLAVLFLKRKTAKSIILLILSIPKDFL